MESLKKAKEKYLCGDLETHVLVVIMEQLKDVRRITERIRKKKRRVRRTAEDIAGRI